MTPLEAQEVLDYAIALHQDYMNAPSTAKLPQLDQAISLYKAVLEVYTERGFPVQWAMTMNNLASAYRNLPTGDREANLQGAISCCQAALRVRTERDFPVQWAVTMNNLASAYSDLPTGDIEANLQQAIECCQAALQVLTTNSLPFGYLQTLRNLGGLYFGENAWQQALEAYTQAIVATEQIRIAALREAERRRIFQEYWVVFERAILCAVRTAQYSSALTLTERGKTRNLADHLWRREVKPHGISENKWQEYQRYLLTATELERRLSATPLAEVGLQPHRERGASISVHNTLEKLSSLRQSTVELEDSFRQIDPDYIPFAPPLEMKDIVELATATNAIIVEFRLTLEGTYIFLVGSEDKGITPEQIVEIPDFKDDVLWQMLVQIENGTPVNGWLVKYDLFRRGQLPLSDWLTCVEQTTWELYDRLFIHVHQRLRQRYPKAKRLILVPNKGLNILPLHACWWETKTGERRYLLDDYDIAYTPSCQVLKRCLTREAANGSPARSLFAVQNPDGTLPFSDWEVEEVCRFFSEENRCVLAGSQATEETARERISFGEEKLFSCHGLFDLTNVEQSHLKLYGSEKLSVPDIVPMDLRGAWLIVKSACETGLTDFRDIIDEYQGLAAAFLVAGAATVVPSLWAVNDFSTALLMQRFHGNLYERKMAKASALCEAQRWLRNLSLEEVEAMIEAKRQELKATGLSQQRMSVLDAIAAKSHLRDLAAGSQGKPFANPHWWGAFQCVGAGWNISGKA